MIDQLPSNNQLVKLTAGIVAAYVGKHTVVAADVVRVIEKVHAAIAEVARRSGSSTVSTLPTEKPKPSISIRKSIQEDYLICMEDGKRFKSLKRHLATKFRMSPDEYRKKWGLPADYPMIAPAYSARRSEMALRSGFGRPKQNVS